MSLFKPTLKQGVVIGTNPYGHEPLMVLLKSLRGLRWPLYIVVNNASDANPAWVDALPGTKFVNDEPGYELGAIKTILERTDLDEFVFLQDTFEIKDLRVFDIVFKEPRSVAFGPTFFHYAGKWRREALAKMATIPTVRNKQESIHWEHTFSRMYWNREDVWVLDPDFDDSTSRFEEAFGRTNMVLENQWMIKRKGTWG